MSMGNFTAILQSQQVISNHNDTLTFTFGEQSTPVVVLSPGHLIPLITSDRFKGYTGAAATSVFVEYCHWSDCVNRDQVPHVVFLLLRHHVDSRCHERRYVGLRDITAPHFSRWFRQVMVCGEGESSTANCIDNSF